MASLDHSNSGIDVDVKIEACGVCGSDVHTVSGMFSSSNLLASTDNNLYAGGWGEQKFPLCVGHGMHGSLQFRSFPG